MAKGDYIKVATEHGIEYVTVEVQGRSLSDAFEKEGNIPWYVVTETTRGGTETRKCYFATSAILEIEKHIKEV